MPVLTSFDPFFRDFERLTEGLSRRGPSPRRVPVDAVRQGDHYAIHFDLPGVEPESVDVTVEKNVLSVRAERQSSPEAGDRVVLSERPQGRFERKLYLGDNLDTDHIDAHYDRGVLSLRIAVSQAAKPRKVLVTSGAGNGSVESVESAESGSSTN
jgi:HSP20 family protein